MKTTTLAVAAALSVAGCAATTSAPRVTLPYDGRVTWIIHPGPTSLEAAFRSAGGSVARDRHLMAFAAWRGLLGEGGTCTIHTMFPGAYESLAELGAALEHEIRHCREGHFHP